MLITVSILCKTGKHGFEKGFLTASDQSAVG
jgi:hypothetical protein